MQAANNKELRNRWQRGYGSGCKIKGPFACIQYSALVEFGSLVRGCECRSASAAVLIHRVGADSAKSFQNVFTMCSLFLWKKMKQPTYRWRCKIFVLTHFYFKTCRFKHEKWLWNQHSRSCITNHR